MILAILFKDGTIEEIPVKTVWQDEHNKDCIYYETLSDPNGEGTFVETKLIKTWQVKPYKIDGNIEL